MIKTNSKGVERRIKKNIPNSIKKIVLFFVVNKISGMFVQKVFSRSMLGARYNFSLVSPVIASRIFFGLWESAEIRFSKKYVNDGDIVIELGSSIGVTLATLCSTKKLKTYISVEASSSSVQVLKSVVAEFSKCNIISINAAISYSTQTFVEFMETSFTESRLKNSIENNDTPSAHESTNSKTYKVKSIQFNDIVDKHIPIDCEYVLISDIEGAEADIFGMDIESLSRCKLIICELEDTQKYSIDSQVNLLKLAGFSVKEYYGNVFIFEKSQKTNAK